MGTVQSLIYVVGFVLFFTWFWVSYKPAQKMKVYREKAPKCLTCSGIIDSDARTCAHCGSQLTRTQTP